MRSGYEKSFVNECEDAKRSLNNTFAEFKKNPDDNAYALEIKRSFDKLQSSAEFMGCENLSRLFNAASKVFSSIYDEYIFYSKRVEQLLVLIIANMDLSLKKILKTGEDSVDVEKTIEYCDKISNGEIIDFPEFAEEEDTVNFSEWIKKASQINSIPTVEIERSQLEELFEVFDGIISKTFKIEKDVESIENQQLEKKVQTNCQAVRDELEDLRDQIDIMRMLPFSTIYGELKESFPKVEFDKGVDNIRLDGQVLTSLVQILPVLFKDKKKKIKVSSIQGKSETTFIIFDPSKKIEFEAIRTRALKLFPEMAHQIANAGEKELSEFLFLKSFTTDSELNWVLQLIDKVRGRIYIQNRENGGCETVISFPNSLATRRGLFVKAGSKTFFVPSNHIQDVISKWRSELFMEQNQYFVNFEDTKVPVYRLSTLFKEKGSQTELLNLLIIEYLEMKVAIAVDEVSAYSAITFRALPNAFKDFNMLLGVAIDAEQRMIPIINVSELLIQLRKMRGFEMKKMEVLSKIDKPKILVVDDSDTSREIEGSILQANGFAVDEAADGILAIEKLKESKYSVIVTDTDMPRMNGLLFLDNVRLMDNYKDVPVIVITPNEDKELMQTYEKAGASAFLSKNDFKRSNLIELIKEFMNGSF